MNAWKLLGHYEVSVICDQCNLLSITIEYQNEDSGECFYICNDCNENWIKDKKLCTSH